MKNKIIAISLTLILIAFIPFTLLVVGLATPSQYKKTYYAELSSMNNKLQSAENKKIVVLGNSAVAFGVDSALMQEELNSCDLDYEVCNFGLYGALGTKLMMDLSIDEINEGDIVVFMPELIPQSMSLYFSAEQTWRALDNDKNMFWKLENQNKQQLVGGYASFVAEKFKYILTGGAQASGIYGSMSFDENCDMKNYSREQNIMQDGYDPNSIIDFSTSILDEQFLNYVNEYYAKIAKKGATMYFYFAPINQKCVTEDGLKNIDAFCSELSDKIDFAILGNPVESIMQAEWFYDANVHLNSYGMTVYTAKLADAIKTRFGIGVQSKIELPDMPELPSANIQGVGDNSHADYFVYQDDGKGGLTVIGLTEEGATQSSLIVPWSAQGKTVTGFTNNVFSGNASIKSITLQGNIRRIPNGSFDGCTGLEKLILKHELPSQIGISTDVLFKDSPNCYVYVNEKAVAQFINDYSWSYYADRIKGAL